MNLCKLFNAKSILIQINISISNNSFFKTDLIQTIQSSIVFVYTQLNIKTVLFQAIQFSGSTQFSPIWPINRTLSDATTPGPSGPRSDGNEEVLRIPQISSITGTSQSDCLGYSLVVVGVPLCRDAVGIFCSPSQQGKWKDYPWMNSFEKFPLLEKHRTTFNRHLRIFNKNLLQSFEFYFNF